jgi:hypothetical protein
VLLFLDMHTEAEGLDGLLCFQERALVLQGVVLEAMATAAMEDGLVSRAQSMPAQGMGAGFGREGVPPRPQHPFAGRRWPGEIPSMHPNLQAVLPWRRWEGMASFAISQQYGSACLDFC